MKQVMRWNPVAIILCLVMTVHIGVPVHAQSDRFFDAMLSSLLRHSVRELRARDSQPLEKYVLLDAREREEFDVSHLSRARWIGYKDFALQRLNGISKRTPIVVYCSVGYRSEKIAERLQAAGYLHVYNLVGGIFEWANHEKPLVDNNGKPTRAVHPYDEVWGRWLKK
ncbi:MAG: rhodanese-like domain-containing protein [Spirochaetota bacterium]